MICAFQPRLRPYALVEIMVAQRLVQRDLAAFQFERSAAVQLAFQRVDPYSAMTSPFTISLRLK